MTLPGARTHAVGAFICAISISLLASKANAFVSDNVNPSSLGNTEVEIIDDASNGCWTNLGEAKTYAADKLGNLGYTVVSEWTLGDASFSVNVTSERDSDNRCYGDIDIMIYIARTTDGIFGYHRVGKSGSIFKGYKNANSLVLEQIKKMIDQMREKQN